MLIYDDGDQAMVVIGDVTHHPTGPHDADMSDEDRATWICGELVQFLQDLFSERVLLWSIDRGAGGGGWRRPCGGRIPPDVPTVAVWSRRVMNPEKEA